MVQKKFKLSAKVSSDNPPAIKPVLNRIFEGKGTVKEVASGFEIDAELEGESAVALNRTLLSELRRGEKKTRMRSQWISGNTTEKFFDYVLKATFNAMD
jgi:ribosomal protein L16/L10AE